MEPCQELIAGEVGYFTASIKNGKDTQVGDTVTGADRPAVEALPGYRPARAMAVSYTHLDVYKRQVPAWPAGPPSVPCRRRAGVPLATGG